MILVHQGHAGDQFPALPRRCIWIPSDKPLIRKNKAARTEMQVRRQVNVQRPSNVLRLSQGQLDGIDGRNRL